MGIIENGTVSGTLPSSEAFAVHYPGYPSSVARAVETLGGAEGILKARSSQSNKLELRFRPEDPYSHPVFGELRSCDNLLLKISKRKSSSDDGKVCADVVARVPEAYYFEGMADYQHVVPVHADVAQRRKKRNWAEMEDPHFEKGGLMDVDQEDVMILLPPLFSLKDVPENLVLRQPPVLSPKMKQDEVAQQDGKMDMEPVLALDFNIKEIPKRVNWEKYVPQGSDQWEWQMILSNLFDERPIWPKESLTERLLDKSLSFTVEMLRRLLSRIAYYFSSGPFLRFWIRKGYDPRKDPDSRIYQRIDFRVPQPLRSYCDANAAKGLKHRWEDICAFRVFPYKFQTSLQFFELSDDYIQQQIRKPLMQTVCTFGTGWFSYHMLNCLRQRLMVRFLSIFPKQGAENLLRAASERFEKLKKECNKGALKHGEEHQQANAEPTENEDNEDPSNVEDDEEDEAENGEEELDQYEALDLAEEDGEISLETQAYLNMENISRTHLQELFDSFPSNEARDDKLHNVNMSDEEYQIYEPDSDGNYSDDNRH
ncbi:General transcription factor 3C polypeptide 5 [Morella rubra]|uniref:General transcription factor 3C polypeptide 5 n=1 Tax=Morella rubra TaxID=262757 RepID=A0A6A1W5Y3_9ROSI|nr:General transcription factor 3C polypeptide 5 [Morella rubra]